MGRKCNRGLGEEGGGGETSMADRNWRGGLEDERTGMEVRGKGVRFGDKLEKDSIGDG